MLMGFCALLIGSACLLLDGSLLRLTSVEIRGLWLIATALVIQVLVISVVSDVPPAVAVSLHVATYVMAGVFLVRNLRLHGVPTIAVGTCMNAVTIAVNGGVLPASAAALRQAGWTDAQGHFANSHALANPKLALLGDNFATPLWVPFSNVYSLGDIVILVGIAIFMFRATRKVTRLDHSRVGVGRWPGRLS
jgi:hypothetical protein